VGGPKNPDFLVTSLKYSPLGQAIKQN